METIFKITGGGQKVKQNQQLGIPIEVERVENSNLVEKSKVNGVDSFTHVMWATDIETIQRWSNEWAGKNVKLVLK